MDHRLDLNLGSWLLSIALECVTVDLPEGSVWPTDWPTWSGGGNLRGINSWPDSWTTHTELEK